jgi:hypothetical protein
MRLRVQASADLLLCQAAVPAGRRVIEVKELVFAV